jgi:hypothetical protein
MNDITSEGQPRSVKNRLQDWREVVIKVDSLLGWELNWYPAVTWSVLTTVFVLGWLWDPTLLSFLAFLGLLVSVTDYAGPKIISLLFGPESWNDTKEKQFEKVCDNITSITDNAHTAINTCRDVLAEKPIIHLIPIMTLISLAWIGNRINNFFLAYLLTLGVAMLPGLHRRGILQKHFSQLSIKFGELLKGQNILKKEM